MILDIRRIEEKDVPKLHELEKSCFCDPWSEAGIRESLKQSHTVLLGAWFGEELAGYIIAYFTIDDSEIARIAVKEPYRRKGAARELLKELKCICRKEQTGKILLDVRKSNEAAAGLYKSFGFAEDGVRKNFYADPIEDAILMSLTVGK